MWVTSAGRGRVADSVLLKEETAFGEGAHRCGEGGGGGGERRPGLRHTVQRRAFQRHLRQEDEAEL